MSDRTISDTSRESENMSETLGSVDSDEAAFAARPHLF
jgi:hypothetical protein